VETRTNVSVERLNGTGVLWDGDSRIGEFHYHIDVSDERLHLEDISGGQTVPGHRVVGGQLINGPNQPLSFWSLLDRALTLQLEDGWRFECLVDPHGRLTNRSGRSLRT